MPVSAMVVKLAEPNEELLERLRRDERLKLGVVQRGRFVPVVLETRTLGESEAAVEELLARHGIQGVDVVSVDFSDGVDGPAEDA